jgi:AcrR family transcriptional regulator
MLYAYKTMPRRRSLATTDIAKAALAVIDRDGVAGLSMRAAAAELGTGTMSLYRYVTDREELERLVVDLVLSDVDPDLPAGVAWDRQVLVLAERARIAVAAHPAVTPLLLAHRHASPNSWRWAEAVLGALTEAGFTGQQRVFAFRSLLAYVMGAQQTTYFGPLAGAGTAALAMLSPAEYPLLAETARYARDVTAEQEFGQGLEIVLHGLRATLSGSPPKLAGEPTA